MLGRLCRLLPKDCSGTLWSSSNSGSFLSGIPATQLPLSSPFLALTEGSLWLPRGGWLVSSFGLGPPSLRRCPAQRPRRLVVSAGAVKRRERTCPKTCEDCQGGETEAEEEERVAATEEEDLVALVAGPLAESRRPQRVEAAFHCRVRRNVAVERRTLQELHFYYLPEKEGSFHRGLGLNLTSGQYTAPITGFYTFAATLYIGKTQQPRGGASRGQPRSRDRLRVLICVQSLCQHNVSLEAVTGLESSSDLFSVSVSGILYLQAGQYASVFVDNATGSPLTVRSGSDFSAVFLGV
ncbi:erythroferrone [Gracilinanus agilis]|uniref:erythroferrone n=1 Tax=Gracilinanus agilis TaxID=191870 RepID=UPI001CFD954C|nr:erythroferrone [Gracilinanus agilis]